MSKLVQAASSRRPNALRTLGTVSPEKLVDRGQRGVEETTALARGETDRQTETERQKDRRLVCKINYSFFCLVSVARGLDDILTLSRTIY